ncbi:hypothetical protein ABZS29_26190 [Kribbella sp. NPDC005582]|uniref:hypothetical protein n=1 Tax=Kribbella sp. NPDC005582 TaxID=3156893 RepID=UPI0033BBDE5F
MTNDLQVPGSDDNTPTPREPRGPHAVVSVITAAFAAVGTLYLMTGSVAVTIIGAIVSLVSVALYLGTPQK